MATNLRLRPDAEAALQAQRRPSAGARLRGCHRRTLHYLGRVARASDVRRVGELWVAMAYRNALPRDETAVMAPGTAGWTSTERLPALLAR